MKDSEFKLCYVDENWAWFTTAVLDDQWGDDWNDAPYEHNAGEPYEWSERTDKPRYELRKIAFDGNFDRPCDSVQNSRYSVERINDGAIPWLVTPSWCSGKVVVIQAGTTLPDFITKIREGGGAVYVEA